MPRSPSAAQPRRRAAQRRGVVAERLAEVFLIEQGCQVLARNYRAAGGEVDLVVIDALATLVFVEVRYRGLRSRSSALESITPAKQMRSTRAALAWLQCHPEHRERCCRFDVISVDGRLQKERINWLSDAFGA